MSPSFTHCDRRRVARRRSGRRSDVVRVGSPPRPARATTSARGRQSLGDPHEARLEHADVGRLEPDRERVDLVRGRAPALVDLGDLVEDLLLELGEVVLRRVRLLLGASACARRSRAVMPRREAAPPIALAIERVLRRPPKSAPSTAPAPATSSVAVRERVSVSSSSTRRWACASAFSSRSRFASSRSRIFAASASARSCAAASQRAANSSGVSPGRETSLSARLRWSSSGRRSTRCRWISFAVAVKNDASPRGAVGRT